MTLDDLYDRAYQEHIEIDDFPMRELTAISFPENWIAIDTKKIKNKKEEKALLAHELGHCETGSFYNIHSSFDLWAKQEYKANKRAFELLIPYHELTAAIQHGITEIWELAEHFGVPYLFMLKAAEYWKQVVMANEED